MKRLFLLLVIIISMSCGASAPSKPIPSWIRGTYYTSPWSGEHYQRATDYSFMNHTNKTVKYIRYSKQPVSVQGTDVLNITFTDGSKLLCHVKKYELIITE